MALTHLRLRVGGTLYNDANWSMGVNFATAQGTDPFANGTVDVQGVLEAFRDGVRGINGNQVLTGGLLGALSSSGKVNYVRASRVGPDGKESAVALVDLAVPVSGTGSPTHQAQTAIVLSLQTGRPGATNRGRLYLPLLSGNLTSGRLSGNDVGALATDAAAWIDALNTAADNVIVLPTATCVASVVSTTRGTASRITSVRVGNRLDSQRRRAEAQKETYGVAAVAQ